MNRRNFFSTLGKGAVAAAAVAILPAEEVEKALPAKLSDIVPPGPTTTPAGTRHFAILMNYRGVPIKTMMIDDLPQEIHLEWVQNHGHNNIAVSLREQREREQAFPSAARQQYTKERSEFRLVSKDMYDGRTIEGLARYIMFRGPEPDWPPVKIGL